MSASSVRATRVAAAGVVALGLCATTLSATPAAATARTVSLTASCAFPSMDPVVVTTTISTELPDTATTTEPVALQGFSVSVTVPEATVAALRTGGTTAIGAGFTVALSGTWQQQPHDIAVPAMTSPDNPLPESGDLPITATADVPAVPVDGPGDATFAVPQVVSTLTLHNGETTTDVPCTEDPGQDGTLGTVTITGAPGDTTTPPTTSGSPTTTTGAPSTSSGAPGSSAPSASHDPAAAAPTTPNPPPDQVGGFDDICDIKDPVLRPAGKAWYKIDGAITVLKLKSNLPVPKGDLIGDAFLHLTGPGGYFACVDGAATMPPAPGYFLMFNFAPVTAVAHVMPGGHSRTKISNGYLISRTEAVITLTDVTVNGVPLDVGPNCHTTENAVIRLAGKYQAPVSSGTVPGIVDLPPFTGCAHGSDVVDPIFNGLVAGDGNPMIANITYVCLYLTCQGKL
ncbi:DUF6801 domain-containing protein [Labedaea rhizosphaerae]|uniref:DUF6801 domain-containing protein n=1 Tax=Labedaea rhizosphaerae TaxID=598644 RepID=A0A4R6S5W4_LABRH|nr:DUF6801 domain-containing protein [Labedaea rhizosphaerae]TDP95162.1 hypothetical protein EV186_105394 [Labedaea rhizosphaerae]